MLMRQTIIVNKDSPILIMSSGPHFISRKSGQTSKQAQTKKSSHVHCVSSYKISVPVCVLISHLSNRALAQVSTHSIIPWTFGPFGRSFRFIALIKLFSVFTSHVIKIKIVTIQWKKSRVWDTIDDWYINNLAKNQVSAAFHSRAICRSVSPKFIELCMETPCLCPSEVTEFCYWNAKLLL